MHPLYILDIEISNLPALCSTGIHLEAIGLLIQNVVSKVEKRMPEYKGEYSDTRMCLVPVVNTTARRLQVVTGTYTFKGSGQCRRCITQLNDRRLGQNRFLTLFAFGQRSLQSDCLIETETVTIQKDLVEAAIKAADTALLDLIKMAEAFQPNKEMKSIIALAESTNSKVKEESTIASTAAELAVSWCWRAANTQLESEINEYQNNARAAMKDTLDAAQRARNFLDQVKGAKRDMEELISVLADEALKNKLQTALVEENAELNKQIEEIHAENAEIDAALEALDVNVTVIYADSESEDKIQKILAEVEAVKILLEETDSGNKTGATDVDANKTTLSVVEEKELLSRKATLLDEALRLERAVENNQELILSSSKSKKKVCIQNLAYTTDPVLQYALKRDGNDVYGSGSNWDSGPTNAKPASTREEWFAKFARLLVTEIPERLEMTYNTTDGGCIDSPLVMTVVITELESKEERITLCTSEAVLLPSLMEASAVTVSSPTASPTSSPITTSTAAPMSSPTATLISGRKRYPTSSPPSSTLGQETSPTTSPPSSTLGPETGLTAAPMSSPTDSSVVLSTLGRNKGPAVAPMSSPTATPTTSPTAGPTPSPVVTPTATPTSSPKTSPTAGPTPSPVVTPTATTTSSPKTSPTAGPTPSPVVTPMATPTSSPKTSPTAGPTPSPLVTATASTTSSPKTSPTPAPMSSPTGTPMASRTTSPPQPILSKTIKYESKQCIYQDKNLGTRFHTPEECVAADRLDGGCGGDMIMWSDKYNYDWGGCRCCSVNEGLGPHTLWDAYQYKEEPVRPTASPTPRPTAIPTTRPTSTPCMDNPNAQFYDVRGVYDCESLEAKLLREAARGKNMIGYLCDGSALKYCKLTCNRC